VHERNRSMAQSLKGLLETAAGMPRLLEARAVALYMCIVGTVDSFGRATLPGH
jgi:hypothetical protein